MVWTFSGWATTKLLSDSLVVAPDASPTSPAVHGLEAEHTLGKLPNWRWGYKIREKQTQQDVLVLWPVRRKLGKSGVKALMVCIILISFTYAFDRAEVNHPDTPLAAQTAAGTNSPKVSFQHD